MFLFLAKKEFSIKLNKWRFIDTGLAAADLNMAIDEALLKNYIEADLPILRLYRWESSISLGRFSNIENSIDLNILKQQKMNCVRRISGGGILVHGGDLSYTIILPKKSFKSKGVKESYRYLCEFLIKLYNKLGYEAGFAADSKAACGKSNICLASYEPYDIIIDGKKIGGNAQRYTNKALFQHGTIPLSIDEECFTNLFLEDAALKSAQTLEKLKSTVTYSELIALLREAFCETFDAELISDTLHSHEEKSVKDLMAEKYIQEKWNIYAKQDNA